MAETDGQRGEIEAGPPSARAPRNALAFTALVLGLVSYLNLLGVEKSVPAVALAVMALSTARGKRDRLQAWAALLLGLLHIVTIVVVLVLFRDQLGDLIRLLHKLG